MDILDIYASDTGGLLGQNQGAGQLPTIPPNLLTKVPTVMPAAPNLLSTMSQAWAQANQPNKSLGLVLADAVQAMPRMYTEGLIARQNAKVAAQQASLDWQTSLLELQKSAADAQKVRAEAEELQWKTDLVNRLFRRPGTSAGQTSGGLANMNDDQKAALALIAPELATAMREQETLAFEKDKWEEEKQRKSPESVAAKTQAEEEGKALAEARQRFPRKYASYQKTLLTLDEMLNAPGLEELLGTNENIAKFKAATFARGTDLADAVAKWEQLQGQAFQEAFQALKGGGSIQLAEGEMATKALLRAQTSQGVEAFKQALGDMRNHIKKMMAIDRNESGYQNLPVGSSPIGYAAGSKKPSVYFDATGDSIELPSSTATYKGMHGEPGSYKYIFEDNGLMIEVTP